jgi:DNA-binding Lrp family transcriptional regulator
MEPGNVNPPPGPTENQENRRTELPISSSKLKKSEASSASPMPHGPHEVIPRQADIDIDILREMYHARAVTIAGVDPRLNASRVAQRLGVSRAKVDARLKEWTEYGLLQRFDVWPNPGLLGRVGFSVDVRLADRFQKDALFERIRLIEGAVGGIDLLGDWVAVQFVVPSETDIQRTVSLVRGLAGVAEVGTTIEWARVETKHELSPLDLRIIRVLRRYPTEPLSVLARHVGVSTRTITTRYGRMVEDLAVWFVPVLDFRALAEPVVSLNVQLGRTAERESISRAIRRMFPKTLEFRRAPFGPILPETFAVFFVLCPSAARLEELEGFVRQLPGVEAVEVLVMIRIVSFPETFDRLVPPAHLGSRIPEMSHAHTRAPR